jgi:hypothetical protein
MKTPILTSGIFAVLSTGSNFMFAADTEASGSGSAATAEGAPANGENAPPATYELPPVPPVVETTEIELKKIVIDAGTQPRVAIDDETVKEYAEIIKQCIKDEQPIPFPPVTIFRDATGRCVLADGFHRYAAHKLAHAKEIECEIREGDERAALLFSLGANQTHGVRRTNKDKQRAVKIAVNDPDLKTLANTDIARLCGVSEFMVRDLRPAKNTTSTRTVTIRGKKTTMKTAAIGKGKGGGAKGAKAAKKAAGKGKDTPAAGSADKNAKSAAETAEQEMDKMLLKIVDNIGAPNGGKFRAAVRDGSLPLSMRDIRDMTSFSPSKQKAVLPLVMGAMRMKPAKAFDFIGSELSEKIQAELHNRAIGTADGTYTFEGEGFKVTVTLKKK